MNNLVLERLYYPEKKGKKGKRIKTAAGGWTPVKPKPSPKVSGARRLLLTVKRAPEVMVKITGGGKSGGAIKAHLDYISRKGAVECENERGDQIIGKDQVTDAYEEWMTAGFKPPRELPEGEGRREVFNIILSMPAGSNRAAVKQSAREFAAEEFAGYQYIFAAHEDEAHPHVHLAVKAVGLDGIRLNPRKDDLQRWRELFAEKLRGNGIEANATRRYVRGKVIKPEKQVIRQIKKAGRNSTRADERNKLVLDELAGKTKHANPAADKIRRTRQSVVAAYKDVTLSLATSKNPLEVALGHQIAALVTSFEPIKSQHELALDRAKAQGVSIAPRSAPGRKI